MSLLPILMALRVRGRAASAAVAGAADLAIAETRARLADAAAAGLVYGDDDALALSAAGRVELDALLAREPHDRVALGALYDEFLATDARLKACITAWQLAARSPVAVPTVAAPPVAVSNAVADAPSARAGAASSPAAALVELRTVAADAHALVARLAAAAERLAPYGRRLAAAADALARGDTRFVANPRVDSLHQVWFELHEDLLVTLGRERAA